MSDTSPRLDLPFLMPAQAQKHVTLNESLTRLDALVQLTVEAFGAETPPASPVEGRVWALGPAPTGAWAGHGGQLAICEASGWSFVTPGDGWRAWGVAEAELCVCSGGTWGAVGGSQSLQNLPGLGVNATSDATNMLAVAAPAVLFSHDGAGHQLKVNKAADTDTASLLFQSGWTGHAEMGLAGDTAFSLKVSADGTAWDEALKADPVAGTLSLGLPVTGAGVQQGATDTTPGRVALAEHAYGPGNLLGPVSLSGGTPTGAVVERGSNADGDWTRWADGTQICWISEDLTYNSIDRLIFSWDFPVPFATGTFPAVMASLRSEFGATPDECELLGPWARQGAGDFASIRVYRVLGGTDFQSGDSLPFYALAVGRWSV